MFELTIILASLGLILATVSFISGLQAVKIRGSIDTRVHRMNGYLAFLIYLILAGISLSDKDGIKLWTVATWGIGLAIIFTKIWIVRSGRAYKYASWMGITLIIIWLIVVYIHIPV